MDSASSLFDGCLSLFKVDGRYAGFSLGHGSRSIFDIRNFSSKMFRRSVAIFAFAMISGCVAQPTIEPLVTTYPRERTENRTKIVNLPIPIATSADISISGESKSGPMTEKMHYSPGTPVFKGSFSETVIGDTAEKELWIVPRKMSEANEPGLLKRLQEGGKRACGSDFRTKFTKYYYGPEATLKFMGINTPALKAKYRCSIKIRNFDDEDIASVIELASTFEDSNYFDVSSFLIKRQPEQIRTAVASLMADRCLETLEEADKNGGYYIVSSRKRTSPCATIPEHMVVFIRSEGRGARVTIMHLVYEQTFHMRGVRAAGTYHRGYTRGPQPLNRKAAYNSMRIFIEQVLKELGQKASPEASSAVERAPSQNGDWLGNILKEVDGLIDNVMKPSPNSDLDRNSVDK